ncbi:MAG: DUF4388 domain-containing protein [Myxococcales bacterium]|nr:MAG: DUF4388 domain-containing protein [Myxococcales bacterium]
MAGAKLSGKDVVDRLLAENRIDPLQYDSALSHAERHGISAVDAVIEIGVISEHDLLRHLAEVFRTRFVSTEKLAKAAISKDVLKFLPHKVAERLSVFPILFDVKSGTLSVVAAVLPDSDIEKQVKITADVRAVRVYIARPAAVDALINKFYRGQTQAFARFFERQQSSDQGMSAGDVIGQDFGNNAFSGRGASMAPSATRAERPKAKGAQNPSPAIALPHIELPKMDALPSTSEISGTNLNKAKLRSTPLPDGAISLNSFLDTLRVLVTLLERDRKGLRGHSRKVSQLCSRLARRLKLDEKEIRSLEIAALLHDLGKSSADHLTPLYASEYEPHKKQAQTLFQSPIELLESVELPQDAISILRHFYERYDGKGFPGHLKGETIPLGSRILALVESYSDLVSNEFNPYQRKLSPNEALEVLSQYSETLFDAKVLEVFQAIAIGDGLKDSLLPPKPGVLLIDPNLDEVAAVELRFIEQGYVVEVAQTSDEARKVLKENSIGLVISEVELEPMDGFALLAQIRAEKVSIPWIFLTNRSDREAVSKGFEKGAVDFWVKPTTAEVVVTKAQKLMSGSSITPTASGIAGSLTQMALPEIVQVFAHGRKSGKLSIESGGKSAEVHFHTGDVYNARFGDLEGDKAFYALLLLTEGQFSVDPSFLPEERKIQASAESLLLEGMRLLDEAERA